MKFIVFVYVIQFSFFLSSADQCNCEFWRSLENFSEFFYHLKFRLLKDFEVIQLFDANCVLYKTIRLLHERNIKTFIYTSNNNSDQLRLLKHRISSLPNVNRIPTYIISYICLDFMRTIKPILKDFPLVRWLLFQTSKDPSNYHKYGCKIGVITVDEVSKTITIEGPTLIPPKCHRVELLAKWSTDQHPFNQSVVGLLDSINKSFIQGQRFSVARLNVYPFFADSENFIGDSGNYTGIDYQVLHTLSEHFHFNYDAILTPDLQWGAKINGSWTGMIGVVYHQNADMAMSDLSMTAEREVVVDYSYPYYFDPICFVVKYPEEIPRALVLLQPLCMEVYVATILSLILTSLVVHIIAYFDISSRRWRITDALWYFYGAITMQGGALTIPLSNKIRIIVAAWWIFCIIVMSGYSGTLISHLNVPSLNGVVDTIEKLLEAVTIGTHKAGTVIATSILNNFQVATEGDCHILGQHISQDPNGTIMNNITQGLHQVYTYPYAFVFAKAPLEAIVANMGKEKFKFSKDQFYTTYYAIALPKGSPLKEMFKLPIFRIIEGGLIEKWYNDLLIQKCIMGQMHSPVEKRIKKHRPLLLEDMRGALSLLGLGLIGSVLVFALEIIVYHILCRSKLSLFINRQSRFRH